MYVDTNGNRAVKCDARESLSDAIEGLTAEDAAYVLGVDNTTNPEVIMVEEWVIIE